MLTLTHGPAGLHLGSSAEDGTVLCESVGRSVVSDSVTLWTVARQALVSVGFSRQECWSGLPFPPPADLLDQGLNRGLLPCRWIIYGLSRHGRPSIAGEIPEDSGSFKESEFCPARSGG